MVCSSHLCYSVIIVDHKTEPFQLQICLSAWGGVFRGRSVIVKVGNVPDFVLPDFSEQVTVCNLSSYDG